MQFNRIIIVIFLLLSCLVIDAQTQDIIEEREILNESNILFRAGKQKEADSLMEVAKKKFPKGILNRNSECNALYEIKGGKDIEKAYKKWIKKYAPSRMGPDIVYDYAAYSVSLNYINEDNVEKCMEYLKLLTTPTWKPTAYNVIAKQLLEKGHSDIAEDVLIEGVKCADAAAGTLSADAPVRRQFESMWNVYADYLYAKGKVNEAVEQYTKVDPSRRGKNYPRLMLEAGNPQFALDAAIADYGNGEATADTEKLLKDAWLALKGTLNGCDDFITQLKTKRTTDRYKEIQSLLISEEAPDFKIKDINGKPVCLSDYRGKIVVLDFWATWCEPCKRSFPAMKKAVEKYKDDANVQFLFIHTWERTSAADAIKSAKDYLDSNGYSDFCLLMDSKDSPTKTNEAVNAYKVSGIPAKFVIDGNGNIRFRIKGFSGTDEEAVYELSTMIDMIK